MPTKLDRYCLGWTSSILCPFFFQGVPDGSPASVVKVFLCVFFRGRCLMMLDGSRWHSPKKKLTRTVWLFGSLSENLRLGKQHNLGLPGTTPCSQHVLVCACPPGQTSFRLLQSWKLPSRPERPASLKATVPRVNIH